MTFPYSDFLHSYLFYIYFTFYTYLYSFLSLYCCNNQMSPLGINKGDDSASLLGSCPFFLNSVDEETQYNDNKKLNALYIQNNYKRETPLTEHQ